MNPIRTAIVSIVIIGAVAGCAAVAAAPPAKAPANLNVAVSTPAIATPVAPTVAPVPAASPVPATTVSAAASSEDTETHLSLYEWKVIAPVTLKAGPSILNISNFGTTQHELLVFKSNLAPAKYPTDAKGDIIEDGPGVTLVSDGENIDPFGAQERAIDLEPGTYVFVCNIPGHFKHGMFTTVTVTK